MSFAPLGWLPKGVIGVGKEVLRHLLKRPVVGLAVVGSTRGRAAEDAAEGIVLIRRGDTGTWALPGGTVEWGETLRETLVREVLEEAGIEEVTFEKVTGVYSRPDRDPRFHAVTIVVRATVGPIVKPPKNAVEIREARVFAREEIPREMAMGMRDFLEDALREEGGVAFE